MADQEFEPRLGRIRSSGAIDRNFLHRALAAATLAGARRNGASRGFVGGRIGRGASLARLLGSRDRNAARRARRAIIKARLVRLGGKGLGAARAHLRYIQRGGVERDGSPGALYSARTDCADGKAFLARATSDRHQFRFIVSAEEGTEYADLKPLTRRLMAQVEADLGTRLDWVAADHFDTGHPHTHILLRGKDDKGDNLVIARDYIAHGMRQRLAELVTLDLGPPTDLEVLARQRLEVVAERMTALDRRLIDEAGARHIVAAGHRDPLQHALRAGRLRKLEALGLARELDGGRWKLDERLGEQLRAMGERGDIIRTMQRVLNDLGTDRPLADCIVHPTLDPGRQIVGQVVERGLSDELADRHYLIVDGLDGRLHHVDIGPGAAVESFPARAIVRLSPAVIEIRPADRAVAEIAAANGGRYGIDLHLDHDPSASRAFAEAHVRRLEALRRAGSPAERLADGSWAIPGDHLIWVAEFEERGTRRAPVRVELLSALPLERLVGAEGATWLDREILAAAPQPLRDAGFGCAAREAIADRRQWLEGEGLARPGAGGPVYPNGLLATLRQRELARAATVLADELGLPYFDAPRGAFVEGRLDRRVDLASGRFAVVANSREFMLLPWRPSLERAMGRTIEGQVGASSISWTIGRRGPEIS